LERRTRAANRWSWIGRRLPWLGALSRPAPFEVALVAVIVVVAEAEIWLPADACLGGPFPFGLCNFGQSLDPGPVAVVSTTLSALALLARRRWPVQVLLLVSSLSIAVAVTWVASPGLGYFLPMLVAAYSVGRYHRGGHPWLTLLGAAVIVFATNAIHDLRVPGQSPSGSLATFYAILIGALPMGRALQTRDLRAELAAAEAREARLARDEAARRAVEEERGRIARELHDVAAHGVSLIVVQSVAAQGVFDSAPLRALTALESIESEARGTLVEMRRLLAAIQPSPSHEGPPSAPPETLEQLVARVVAAGQPVEAQLDCDGRLSGSLGLAVYRCLQEALTNAVKHAPGSPTSVLVRCAMSRVDIEVVNAPPPRQAEPGEPGDGGRGLAGMRERVRLNGGSFAAGPTARGGFRLQVSIPMDDAR
jgi:signal transduction histidine kinase